VTRVLYFDVRQGLIYDEPIYFEVTTPDRNAILFLSLDLRIFISRHAQSLKPAAHDVCFPAGLFAFVTETTRNKLHHAEFLVIC